MLHNDKQRNTDGMTINNKDIITAKIQPRNILDKSIRMVRTGKIIITDFNIFFSEIDQLGVQREWYFQNM